MKTKISKIVKRMYNLFMKTKKTSFSAVVELPKDLYGCNETTLDIELDKDEEHLTYDEVEDAIYNRVDEIYGPITYDDDCDDEDYPQIVSIVINCDDGSYPVISESMDDSELKNDNAFEKFLVLPDACYSLTPECQLWLDLKKEGILDEDAPFEFEKFHRMIENRRG